MGAPPVVAPSNGSGGASSLYGEGDSTFEALSKISDAPDAPETQAPAAEPGAAPTLAPPAPDAAAPPAVEPWLETAPKELQGLMGHANLSKEAKDFLKSLYTETSGYRDSVGPIEDAKTFRELFPGGMTEAKEVAETVTQAMRSNQLFDSGDPDQQAQLFTELSTENPAAFLTASQVALDLVRQQMPNEYGQIRAHLAADHMNEIEPNFVSFMDDFAQKAKAGDANAIAQLGYQLGNWWEHAKGKMFPKSPDAAAKPDPKLQSDREKFASERGEFARTNMEYKHAETVKPIFTAEIAKEAKARGLNLSEARIAKLAKDVQADYDKQLMQDRNYNLFLDRTYFKGNRNNPAQWDASPATMDKVMQTLAQRTKQVAGSLAQKAVGDWIAQLKEAGLGNAPTPADTTAAAGIRGGARPTPKGGLTEEKLGDKNKSTLDLLNEITA